MAGKPLSQIQAYSECFWKNYTKIDNYKKYIERIEKGENEIAKRLSIDKAIDDKFAKLITEFKKRNPEATLEDFRFDDIQIKYEKAVTTLDEVASNPFLNFSPNEDKVYAYCLFKYTYGYWDITRNELRNNPYLLYNWAVHTRTNLDI